MKYCSTNTISLWSHIY